MHVHFPDSFNSLQCQLRQHIRFNAPQEHVLFHLFHVLFTIHSELVVAFVHDSDAQHELLRVVVVKDAVQVITEAGVDLFGNLFHCQLLIRHTLAIELDTQQPWRDLCWIEVRHFVVNVDEFLIFGDN